MKKIVRVLAIVICMLSLFGCGKRSNVIIHPDNISGSESVEASASNSSTDDDKYEEELSVEQKVLLEQQSYNFAINFPYEFESVDQLNHADIAWYTFWELYQTNNYPTDKNGRCVFSKDLIDNYVKLHFDLDLLSNENIPNYRSSEMEYHFSPIGEGTLIYGEVLDVIYNDNETMSYIVSLYKELMGEENLSPMIIGSIKYNFKIIHQDNTLSLRIISATLH